MPQIIRGSEQDRQWANRDIYINLGQSATESRINKLRITNLMKKQNRDKCWGKEMEYGKLRELWESEIKNYSNSKQQRHSDVTLRQNIELIEDIGKRKGINKIESAISKLEQNQNTQLTGAEIKEATEIHLKLPPKKNE